MFAFLRLNQRWLAAGFLLTFASAFGQTWFISLFASAIKTEHGLTDGAWGSLYTVATLCAAALMFWRGSVADTVPLSRLAPVMALVFAAACTGMAVTGSIWVLGVSLFLLRFCGQGMFSHIAMTAMGRWFEVTRGKAVSIANLGHPASEIVVPVLLLPMGVGIALLGPFEHVVAWYLALGLIGITQGTSATLWGVLLPAAYGTRHLGSIRSLTMTIMVISTAIGPGITGILIDRGIDFPVQSLFMGSWCFLLAGGCWMIARRLAQELSLNPG